eukprot:2631822-Amphidinium_carterae.3
MEPGGLHHSHANVGSEFEVRKWTVYWGFRTNATSSEGVKIPVLELVGMCPVTYNNPTEALEILETKFPHPEQMERRNSVMDNIN